MATAKSDLQTLIDMLKGMQEEIAELKAGNAKGTTKAGKPKAAEISFPVSTLKTQSLGTVERHLGTPVEGKCTAIVYPKKRDYEIGNALKIHRCKQAGTIAGRCTYHDKDNATRHANWQALHARLFPVWQATRNEESEG